MLKKRLIACLLWNNGVIVQSINFKHTNAVGNALTAVDFFHSWTVDEIIVLDVSRQEKERSAYFEMISALSSRCFIPLTVGGKLRNTDDMRQLFKSGADKVTINTEAVRRPDFLQEAALIFGRQAIVVSIDAKRENDAHMVYINCGSEPTGLNAVEWAKKAEEIGAGEILLTSIDEDGARQGYDLKLVRDVSQAVNIPVIASGGVGNWQHFVEGIREGKAEAVSAANIFHFSEHSTKKAKDHMIAQGVEVREPVFYAVSTPRNPKYTV